MDRSTWWMRFTSNPMSPIILNTGKLLKCQVCLTQWAFRWTGNSSTDMLIGTLAGVLQKANMLLSTALPGSLCHYTESCRVGAISICTLIWKRCFPRSTRKEIVEANDSFAKMEKTRDEVDRQEEVIKTFQAWKAVYGEYSRHPLDILRR